MLFSSGSVIQSTLISSVRSSFHTHQLQGHWNPLSNGNNCAAILLLGRPIHLDHFYHSRTGRSLPACFYFLLMSSLDWQERVATRAARSAVGHVFSIYSLDIFYNVLYWLFVVVATSFSVYFFQSLSFFCMWWYFNTARTFFLFRNQCRSNRRYKKTQRRGNGLLAKCENAKFVSFCRNKTQGNGLKIQ